jgi:hypothetical protein
MITVSMTCCEPPRRALIRAAAVAAALLAVGLPASAHKASDAYLQVQAQPGDLQLRWDIALRDLESLVELDADGDRRLTWGEVKRALPQIEAVALDHLQVTGCPLQVVQRGLERRSDGTYVALTMHSHCTPPAGLPMRYTLFAGVDATHRGIARIAHADGHVELRLLDPATPQALPAAAASTTRSLPEPLSLAQAQAGRDGPPASAPVAPTPSVASAPRAVVSTTTIAQADGGPPMSSFVLEGVHHILSGYDHLLFLLCLLLPSVLRRTPQGWRPVDNARQALGPVLRIVTLFTLAHSITLSLAALGKVDLPSSFIEPAIAATIIVAAIDNLWPIFGRWRGAVTFAFGLVHGFGFAGVLRELQLPTMQFASALLRFNLGIEVGQLAVVACVVPLLLWQRERAAYPRWALQLGSGVAIALAAVWFVERTADISLLPI